MALIALPLLCSCATLTGVVLDDKGKAVDGAIVTVHRSTAGGPLRATESYMKSTLKDGSFSVPNLGEGPFIICAIVPKSNLLDPCQWSDAQQIVRVPSGTGTVNATVQLQPGATISIHADDPDSAIAATPDDNSKNTLVVMGVWSPKHRFHQAWHSNSDAKGHDYELVIPPNVDLQFAVSLLNLTCRDDSGADVDDKKRTNINLGPNQKLQLHYTMNKKP